MSKKSKKSTAKSSGVNDIVESVIKAFIDDGNLSSNILEGGVPLYDHISFFGWEPTSLAVIILLTGKSP